MLHIYSLYFLQDLKTLNYLHKFASFLASPSDQFPLQGDIFRYVSVVAEGGEAKGLWPSYDLYLYMYYILRLNR